MGYLLIKNGRVIDEGVIQTRDLLIRDALICDADFSGQLPEDCRVIDAAGKYVSAGFVEIHSHGAGGADMMDASPEAFAVFSRTHLMHGTTTVVGTTMTAPFESIRKVVRAYREAAGVCPNLAGIHLEGPFLSREQNGAHKPYLLHTPTEEEREFILTEGKGVIRRITAAPELDGMMDFAREMAENGIEMSVGHSNVTSDLASAAFRNGFDCVTHLYNATPTWRKLHERLYGGVVEAAYLNDDIAVEIIGDGKHVADDCARLARKVKPVEKIVLVSDSLRPAGQNVTESWSGEKIPENRIIIEDDVAKLPDRSFFAGSIALGDRLLRVGVRQFGFSLPDTIRMMTENPARVLKRTDIGHLKAGFRADAVIFDEELRLEQVIQQGQEV